VLENVERDVHHLQQRAHRPARAPQRDAAADRGALPQSAASSFLIGSPAIQGWLGHWAITSTTIYTALAPNRFKDFWRH
jgi:hypothetical protein